MPHHAAVRLPTPPALPFRDQLSSMVMEKVAGSNEPAQRAQIHLTPGERWFAPDRPIRQVQADTSMFVGGLSALLLQSLHPLAMTGVAQHSDYKTDPWGRLQRTSYFLAVTAFGAAEDADAAVARVRGIHRRVKGVAADGRQYSASDPHLLEWVHVAEAVSFLAAYQRYGAKPLDQERRDGYVEDLAVVARKVGVVDPPTTEAQLRARLDAFRPELRSTPEARSAARYLLVSPPLPLLARGPYATLAAASIGLLPLWARWPLRLPYLPIAESTVVRAGGDAMVRTLRWALAPRMVPQADLLHE